MSILDPVKDMNGSNLRVESGLSTREREAAEMTGTDLEENIAQLAYEQKLIEQYGLSKSVPAVLAGRDNPPVGTNLAEEGGDKDDE